MSLNPYASTANAGEYYYAIIVFNDIFRNFGNAQAYSVAVERTREDKAEVRCIVFIRYDDGRQKVIE
jgi:hypothetical protein